MYRHAINYSRTFRANVGAKSIVKVPAASIVSHHVTTQLSLDVEKKKSMYNLIGERKSTSAFIYLNRGHKYNTLSEGVIYDFKRFLESYEVDDIVSAVWLQNKGTTFSKGMDIKSILHNVENNNQEEAYHYIRKVYDFSMFLGSYMKPLIVLLDGEIANASAAIFASRPHIIATPNSKWSFNETSFGYITDCGASYHLSRMPFEMGTYLALTGHVLTGKEIQSLKLAFDYTERDLEDLRVDFTDTNGKVYRPSSSLHLYGDKYEEAKEQREDEQRMTQRQLEEEIDFRVNTQGENAKLVLAEIKYRQELLKHSNRNFGSTNPTNRMGFDGQPLINHTLDFERMILESIELRSDDKPTPKLPFEAINRCFKGSTVEEIFRDLEEEGTEWSRQTLKVLKTKSMMSLKLTLRLIREGLRSEWGDCLKREYRVACRRINDAEFKKAAAKLGNKEQFNDWTYKKLEDISPELLDKYFAPLEQDLKVEEYKPTLPQHSVAPFKDFYQQFPDKVRYWLNKQNIKDMELRNDYLFDVQSYMAGAYAIDIHNPLYTHDLIRERVHQVGEQSRRVGLQYERLFEIARSRKNIHKFYDNRKDYIERFFRDTKQADQAIHDTVAKLFEEKFEENLAKKQKFAADARRQEKKSTFRKIKKSITDQRLIEHISRGNETHNDREAVVAENATIPLFFPLNPYESFLDIPNPQISAVHPYIKYAKDIKQSKRLGTTERDPFMRGLIHDETIGTFVLTGEHKDATVPSKENVKSSIPVERENFEKLNLEIKAHETLHGEDPVVSRIRDRQYENVLDILLDRKDSISKLLKKDPKAKEYLLDTVRKGNYGDNIATENVTLETLLSNLSKEVPQESIDEISSLSHIINKSFDSILGTRNFVDLEPEALKGGNSKPKGLVVDHEAVQQDAENNYEKQFIGMLNLDERLSDILSPILNQESLNPASKTFALKLKDLLLEIYKRKVNQVLKTERDRFKNIKPLFTKDGNNVLNPKNSTENDEKFMETIDDYIHNNVLFEFHRYISSHVFFAFSYFGLLELEKMYTVLTKVIGNAKRSGEGEEKGDPLDANFSMVAKLLREKDIKIANKEELTSMLQFLNDATANICRLYYIFQDQLHFNEDLLLENFLKVKYGSATGNKKNFVTVAQEHFQNYHLFKEGMSSVGQKFQDDSIYKPNSEAYRMAFVDANEMMDDEVRDIWESTLEGTSAHMQPSKEYKNFIPGSFQYLIDLERATKRATYGKFHAFAGEDIPEQDIQIPEYFADFDLREPIPVWFDKKLKEVLRRYLDERSKFQDLLSREDLIALDQDFTKLLNPKNIKETITTALEDDMAILTYYRDVFEMGEANVTNIEFQLTKAPPLQSMMDKKVKNPEALNKFMAYGLSMYDKYKTKDHKKMNPVLLGVRSNTLERLYNDAFKEPRPEPGLETYTDVLKGDESTAERDRNIKELRVLSENNINDDTSRSLRKILEETSEKDQRHTDLRSELEYFFKRYDVLSNQ